ncbi:MAG: hypothetical protein KAH20_05745 [Methylococcales bacterium]|nr:hypothetical protein [Methylococcales bacterium]
MKKIISLALLLVCSFQVTAEDIVVIGNIDNTLNILTKRQVIAIFMGRTRKFSNGIRALPLDEASLRNEFYERLTHRSISQIDAYWARLTFSGSAPLPPVRQDQQSIITEVKKAKGKIAYIKKNQLDESQVKLLFSIESEESK